MCKYKINKCQGAPKNCEVIEIKVLLTLLQWVHSDLELHLIAIMNRS